MKFLLVFFVAFILLSCEQPVPAPISTPVVTPVVAEKVLGPEYAAFTGDFIHEDSRGFTVLVSFLGKDDVMAVCITANAKPYFYYTFILDNGTITTNDGEPLIWWFKCRDFPYRWENADTLIVTDPVNNRVLILRRR